MRHKVKAAPTWLCELPEIVWTLEFQKEHVKMNVFPMMIKWVSRFLKNVLFDIEHSEDFSRRSKIHEDPQFQHRKIRKNTLRVIEQPVAAISSPNGWSSFRDVIFSHLNSLWKYVVILGIFGGMDPSSRSSPTMTWYGSYSISSTTLPWSLDRLIVEKVLSVTFTVGFVWKCCVPQKTQWFCWSFSLWKMAHWED